MNPYGIFVNINNSVYVANKANNLIQIWLEGNMTLTKTLSGGLVNSFGIFVTITDDIYIDNGYSRGQVDKWTLNVTSGTAVMYVNGSCYGLFIDIYHNLYCSLYAYNQVVKKSINDNTNTSIVVAGNSSSGAAPSMLNGPRGIFIDTKLNLYVVDGNNNRIQLFQSGQLNGTTVAGAGANGTIILVDPTGVVLDADGYLFISDTNNNRIVGSGPNGFRCIIGCSHSIGNGSDQLHTPSGLSFDNLGNLFVADAYNDRIQKFFLSSNSCGKFYK